MIYLPPSYKKLKRGPQIILPKDIGMIIAYSGIDKTSVCIDAGTGSGWLAVSLAKICKRVISYEIREDFAKIAEKNKIIAAVPNLKIKLGDIKGAKETNVDLVTLDFPGSEKAVKIAHKCLKPGGCIVGYLPNIEQVKKFVTKLNYYKFYEIETFEVIVRDILVRKEGVRPSTKGVWHTAYLTFGRNHIRSRTKIKSKSNSVGVKPE